MSHPLVRPVSARSAMLTFLIGGPAPVEGLTAANFVHLAVALGISEATARVALSRMVSTGDLVRSDALYALSDRLHERQQHQRAKLAPKVRRWRGDWEMVLVTETGRSAADRAALRTALVDHRLAELREGVWLRPDNLAPWPETASTRCIITRSIDDASELAAELFDPDAWAERGWAIVEAVRAAGTKGDRFAACVAGVRHLLTDPVLPPELLPAAWPATDLREEYDESLRWMATLLER